MTLHAGFTREQLLACIDRELRFRERVFVRRVERGQMTIVESMSEMAKMRAIRAIVADLPETQARLALV